MAAEEAKRRQNGGRDALGNEFPACTFQFHLPAVWPCIQILCPVREVLRGSCKNYPGRW